MRRARVARLREELERVRYERDLFSEQLRDPALMLNLFLDTRGVEPCRCCSWADDKGDLPGCIRISAELSKKVFR